MTEPTVTDELTADTASHPTSPNVEMSLKTADGDELLLFHRLALDFGIEAAWRAMEKIPLPPQDGALDPSTRLD